MATYGFLDGKYIYWRNSPKDWAYPEYTYLYTSKVNKIYWCDYVGFVYFIDGKFGCEILITFGKIR